MKKGFISVYTLFVLLIVSLFTSFIYDQNNNNIDFNNNLLARKENLYKMESVTNIFLEENLDSMIYQEAYEYLNKYESGIISNMDISKEPYTSPYDNKTYKYFFNLMDKVLSLIHI